MVSHNSTSTITTTPTTSELFICFTSRLSSSSSMKITKSILSPDKFRDPPQISLSSSLSRRLRTNGSLKGGQSPMFPTGGKRRGCGFDNPEPSSPKVTCIGQVRVKSKNKGKKIRSRSQRRGAGGEISFRKIENGGGSSSQDLKRQNSGYNRSQQMRREDDKECFPSSHNGSNQKWIHIPVTICETIRSFGAELNCFLPCKSSCASKEESKGNNGSGNGSRNNNNSSCGAVFARWLVAVQEGEGVKGREIELVVGGEEEEGREYRRSYQRRHVMEDIDFTEIDQKPWEGNRKDVEKDEESRVSICVPPKNALLLMRCRSDPLRMAALANKFWECPLAKEDEDIEEVDEKEEFEECQAEQAKTVLETAQEEEEEDNKMCEEGYVEEGNKTSLEMEKEEEFEDAQLEEASLETVIFEEEEKDGILNKAEEETEALVQDTEANVQMGRFSIDYNMDFTKLFEEEEEAEEAKQSSCSLEEKSEEEEEEKSMHEKDISEKALEEEVTQTHESFEELQKAHERERVQEEEEREREDTSRLLLLEKEKEREEQQEERSSVLPDCLLLMMCEPKLSMEVSKETWVCSTDFIRWLPERKVKQPEKKVKEIDAQEEVKKRVSIDCNPAEKQVKKHAAQAQQTKFLPPRSSCSYPAPPASMAAVIEQKLASTYEPFVLTRCKSEPMRSSAAAKFAPTDACFWKNRKLEPHRGGAAIGIGATGIGF